MQKVRHPLGKFLDPPLRCDRTNLRGRTDADHWPVPSIDRDNLTSSGYTRVSRNGKSGTRRVPSTILATGETVYLPPVNTVQRRRSSVRRPELWSIDLTIGDVQYLSRPLWRILVGLWGFKPQRWRLVFVDTRTRGIHTVRRESFKWPDSRTIVIPKLP